MNVDEGWYADRFGFHHHPDDWSSELNIKRRAHERCRRAWVELVGTDERLRVDTEHSDGRDDG